MGAAYDGTGFEYSATATVSECIQSIYLVVLAQFSRYQSIKFGKRRGKFKSTAAIIGQYTDSRIDGDSPNSSVAVISVSDLSTPISTEESKYLYSIDWIEMNKMNC